MVSYSFLPKIISCFYDYENIYLVTNIFNGKSLNYYRSKTLTEEQIKFVSACIIESLTYLRKENIIHRDIMMKNIIMDKDKYFNVIDFSYSINYLNRNFILNLIIMDKSGKNVLAIIFNPFSSDRCISYNMW